MQTNKEKVKEIIGLIDNWIHYQTYIKEIPSVSVGIFMDDETIFQKAYGYANLETKTKATPSTLYRIASHSKLFTTTAIMKLYSEDKLSLDDRVSQHLEWFQSSYDEKMEHIRIRHLLTHSSGITRDSDYGHWCTQQFPNFDEMKAMIQKGISVFGTSEHYKYSNIGFTILGMIVSKVSGQSFEDYILALAHSLDMEHTYPDLSEENLPRHATGYGLKFPNEPRQVLKHASANIMNSATGLSSNVEDLIKFYQAHMFGNDRLFLDLYKREMQRVQFQYRDIQRGLGFVIKKMGQLSYVSHGGSYQGFETCSGLNQEHKLILVVLLNTINGPAQMLFTGISDLIHHALTHYEDYGSESKATQELMKSIDFSEIQGFYSEVWGVLLSQKIRDSIVSIAPGSDNPAETLQICQHERDLSFKFPTTHPDRSPGEIFKFEKNEEGDYQINICGDIFKKFEFPY